MLIPLVSEESLRQSEVAAYDPFVVSSRMVLGSTFTYGGYNLGELNGDFSSGSLAPWEKGSWSGVTSTLSLDTAVYRSSPASAKHVIDTNTNSTANDTVLSLRIAAPTTNYVNVEAGQTYTVNGYVRTSTTSLVPRIAMVWVDAAGATISENFEDLWTNTSANTWQFRTYEATAPASAVKLIVSFRTAQTEATTVGTVWVDDVEVKDNTTAIYKLGDEVFDGVSYHEVVQNSPFSEPYTSGSTLPSWSTQLGGFTTSGTVKFQNIGKSSRKYGRTDEVLMRIGYGSFAFVQIAFPRTITSSIGPISLVLTAPIFQMNSVSDVLLSPVVVYEPQALEFDGVASSEIVATGSTISSTSISSSIPRYVGDVEMSSAGSIRATGEIFINGELAPLMTQFVALPYAESNLTASLVKVRSGSAVMKSEGNIDTGSLVVGLVKQQFEPLDFESIAYPTIWPPDYLDDTKLISVGIPRFGEQVAIDLSDMIETEREFYTLVIFRSSDTVWRNVTITDGRLVAGDVKEVTTVPILVGGDQSTDIQPYARPVRNPRTLSQTLGGPYVGYIVDTYETETGQTFPIPWFDSTEAKRIAQRMTETNFYSTEPGLETKIEYNASSQEFVVTQSDFRIIEGIAQNGIKTELQRISPVRIGSRLLYPIGTYDIPWLLARTDYNPNPIIRLQGALPVALSGSAVFTAVTS